MVPLVLEPALVAEVVVAALETMLVPEEPVVLAVPLAEPVVAGVEVLLLAVLVVQVALVTLKSSRLSRDISA